MNICMLNEDEECLCDKCTDKYEKELEMLVNDAAAYEAIISGHGYD